MILGTHGKLVLGASVKLCEDLKRLSVENPDEAKNLLTGAWGSHLLDYSTLARSSKDPVVLENLVALVVLSAYFREQGDWAKMIEYVKNFEQGKFP